MGNEGYSVHNTVQEGTTETMQSQAFGLSRQEPLMRTERAVAEEESATAIQRRAMLKREGEGTMYSVDIIRKQWS